MRVLMVSDVYFPRVNGVSTSIETFRRALAAEGVEVRVVAPRYGDEADAAGVVRVPARPVPRDPEDRLVAWRAMHATVAREAVDSDVIHVQTPFVAHFAALAAARSLQKPVVATYHTLFEEYLHHYAPFLPAAWLQGAARCASRRQCDAMDAVIVPSSAMRERLLQYGVRAPLHVVPTGIPTERFAAGDGRTFREQLSLGDRPVALFVGRLAFEKNIDFLLDALVHARRVVPDLVLVIAGEGPATGALHARVDALGIAEAVRFVGYLDRAHALRDCYAAADCFVFASRTETQGLVLLEAMAAGVPVVALSVMGTRDILAPGLGCLTPKDNVVDFAAAMARVVRDTVLRGQLGREARDYAQEWADHRLAAKLAHFYRALAEGGGDAGRRAVVAVGAAGVTPV